MFKELIYPDIKNIYLISEYGVVINKYTHKEVKSYVSKKTGYVLIKLARYTFKAPVLLHRLVAETFVGSVKDMEVNHEDCNKQNNFYKNLTIVTSQDNTLHAYANNLCQILENKYNASLTNNEVHKICRYLEKGKSYEFIMNKINVKKDVLKKIANGKNYKNISLQYSINSIDRRYKENNEKLTSKIINLLNSGITKQREITNILNIEYSKKHINLIKNIKRKYKKERSTTIESDYYEIVINC